MPNVIMLIVVVDIVIIEHGLRRPAFYGIGRSRYFVASRYVTVCFGNDLAFGRSYKLQEGFVKQHIYLSFV